MIMISIVTRTLRKGKTYEDFRKAWYHSVGFGVSSKLFTMINVANPREIVVIGMIDIKEGNFEELLEGLKIDVKERVEHSLDDIIEPEIERKFGVLISEDDFSAKGTIDYKPATINGKEVSTKDFEKKLSQVAEGISKASEERDRIKKK